MPIETHPSQIIDRIAQVEQTYAALMQCAAPGEDSLGGKLLYIGELDQPGSILATAANIAGAATLAASADPSSLRHAQREGVIDFLVNSLDEALRILKNEIRKREPVAVAISLAPEAIEKEMLDRGVLPNLLPPQPASPEPAIAAFIAQGAQPIASQPSRSGSRLLIWQIPEEFAQRPAAFDSLLLEHISQIDCATRRWLRLSPRYLGPKARRLRSLACDEEAASRLIDVLGSPLQK